MGSARERLGLVTKLVADTGDLESIRKLKPVDATTNPSLILAAVGDARFADLVDAAIKSAQGATPEDQVVDATDRLAVAFGTEITKLVPGYVSTEVDARLSFDTAGTIAKAHKIISLYEEKGISKDRILIKIAATWEGIKAAEVLEKQGIRCNITLLFNFFQAVAAAEAKVTLISPFVGRILDWYKAAEKRDFTPEEDPGVLSVRQIYNYYKRHGHETIVMGASFRSAGEVLALAGCDRLTISPQILEQLETMTEEPKYVKLMACFTGLSVVVVFTNPVEEYLLPPHAEGHLLVRGCPIGGGGRPVEQKVDEHGSTTASCSLPDAVIRKELPDYEALSVNGKSLPVPLKLDAEKAKSMDIPKVCVDERTFRWEMNQDAMATEKLAEGIRKFAADLVKLETIVKSRLG